MVRTAAHKMRITAHSDAHEHTTAYTTYSTREHRAAQNNAQQNAQSGTAATRAQSSAQQRTAKRTKWHGCPAQCKRRETETRTHRVSANITMCNEGTSTDLCISARTTLGNVLTSLNGIADLRRAGETARKTCAVCDLCPRVGC